MPEARAATLRRAASGRTDVVLLVGAVLGVAAAAWAATAERMAGMDAGPGTELGGVGWFTVSWLLMMAAMMLPALTPMVVAYGRRAARSDATATFASGYMAAWAVAGLVGYGLIDAVRSLGLGWFAWGEGGRYVAAGVIVVAGLYQLTGAKRVCLRRCGERAAFLRDRWRVGRLGALRMGAEHGAYCVGCCWAMMAALFALGVMSLAWMAVMAVLISAERLVPRPARVGVAVVLVALGTWVAVAPGGVPGLTLPEAAPVHGMPMR